MPGRYKPAAPELDFEEMALMDYDQDFLPADDNFSYWDSPDFYPEMYSIFPRDTTTVGTAISPMTQCDVNSLNVPIDGPTDQRSSSSSSLFGQNENFRFCDTFRSTEHTEIQDCKSSTMQHASLCAVKLQTTAHIPTCVPKIISLSSSALTTESSCSEDTENETAIELAPRKRRRLNVKRDRNVSFSSSIDDTSAPIAARRQASLPHKQVERKYREGLNSEMERLRKAVPTLSQSADLCAMGVAKPSKGMVLAAAINYILKIEHERDLAIDEIERLGGHFRVKKLDR